MKRAIITCFVVLILIILSSGLARAQNAPTIIITTQGPKCYNTSFYLKIQPINNTGLKYDWEVGDVANALIYNGLFDNFLAGIIHYIINLNGDPYGEFYQNILRGIMATEWDYMKDYLYLYNEPLNKIDISNALLIGIINQGHLGSGEQNFVSQYFSSALLDQGICPPPYINYQTFKLLKTVASGKNETDSVEFSPNCLNETITTRRPISFRAQNTTTKQWSNIVMTDILPPPPRATITVNNSACSNKASPVSISITEIQSPGIPNNYTWRINGDPEIFTGTLHNITDSLKSGKDTLYIDYNNHEIDGCPSTFPLDILSLPELDFSITKTDVTCPGGNDGSLKVEISTGAGSYYIKLNNEDTIKSTSSHTFTSLYTQSATVKLGDLCRDTSVNRIIEQPLTVKIESVNSTHPTCTLNPNGGFTINVSGGTTGKFDYRIYDASKVLVRSEDNKSSPRFYDSLSAGTYTIKVQDNSKPLCEWIISEQTLNAVQSLNLSVIKKTDVNCFGQSTGEIKVTATGGSSSYTFKIGSTIIENGTNTATFSNPPSGNYTVEVRNNNTCSDMASVLVTVTTNPLIVISLTPADVKCFGDYDGQIAADVSGGSGPYTYSWETNQGSGWDPCIPTNSSITELYPGQYRLTVTDQPGCQKTSAVTTIAQPAAALSIITVTPHDIVCFGSTGSIDIVAAGGNGGYKYYYSANSGASCTEFTSGSPLPAGTYTLKAIDSKGCEAMWEKDDNPVTVKITGPDIALSFTTAQFNIFCNGNATGSITVSATGGNGEKGGGGTYNGYTYSLPGRADQSNGLFGNLAAGTYSITVTDNRGCPSSQTVTLTQPAELDLSVSAVIPVKCYGSATGVITVVSSNGVPPYSYKKNGGDFGTSNVFSNLVAGTYIITVKDNNSCLKTISATVVQSINIQTTISTENVTCNGENNGRITATISGGLSPFTILWEKMVNGNWQTTAVDNAIIENLGPGKYRLTATDLGSCSAKDSTAITEPSLLSITRVELHDIKCMGETGSINIEAGGGSLGGSTFQLSKNSQAYEIYSPGAPLMPATYKLKVTDSKGCQTVWPNNLIISQPDEPLGFTYSIQDYKGYSISCFGNNDGRISVKPSGGNGAGYQGYSYLLSGRPVQTDSVFGSLTAGTYSIEVTDTRGCAINKQVILTQALSEINLWASATEQAVCINDTNGKISLAASGGNSPYTYSAGNDVFVTGNEFANLKVGTYSFTLKDANGCRQVFNTSIVNTVPEMKITGIISDALCFGQNSGAIITNISGGAIPFNYQWKDNSSVNSSITRLLKGKYTVSVTDAAGCKAEQFFEVNEPATALVVTAISQPACISIPNGLITPLAGGGTPPYLFGIDNQSQMQSSLSFMTYSGRHRIFAADANNCLAETEITVNVKNSMPLVNFMAATSRYELDTLVIVDVSVPKPDSVGWGFSPEATVIETGLFSAKVKFDMTGIYPVKMTGYFGTCDYDIEKLLSIAPFDSLVNTKDKLLSGIESVQITPNPNSGQFKVKVKLYTKQQINIKVLDYFSKTWYSSRYPASIEFEQDISIAGALPGTYVLWIVSDNDSKALLFIISQ